MEHHHDHYHGPVEITGPNKAFAVGISLNLLFVTIEVIAGFKTNSLSLLTDAGHNLGDVGSLFLSLLAFRLAKIKPNQKYTYGYKKTTILASLANAVLLLVAVGAILWETYTRIGKPVTIQANSVAIVALIGIIVNAITALLFFRDRKKDINIKGAYLHLLADAMVSAGVVIGGVLMYFTRAYWIDLLLSCIIAGVILYSTWGVLKESFRLSLNAVPEGIDLAEVARTVQKTENVESMHHIHIWAISSTQNAMTAHLVVKDNLPMAAIARMKARIRHELQHLDIHHITLEVEQENENCSDKDCWHIT